MSPEALLRRCRDNDEYAWEYAFNYVMAYLDYLKVPAMEKEDIAQDTIKYWIEGRLQNIKTPFMFKYFLRQKAKGIFLKHRNAGKLHPTEPLVIDDRDANTTKDNPDVPPVLPDVETLLWVERATGIIQDAIAGTGKTCRHLLSLYYEYKYLGKKIKTLAQTLNMNYAKLRTDIHRCNLKLFEHPEYQKLLVEYRDHSVSVGQ